MKPAHAPADHPSIPKKKTGILIANLGTPDGHDYWSMRRYLNEFLSDKLAKTGRAGWVAEEALAIALYAALTAQAAHPADPAAALALALRIGVNHDGDSDSTASLAGQVLGAAHGTAVFGAHDPADRAAAEASVPGWIAEREVVLEAARRWSAATT